MSVHKELEDVELLDIGSLIKGITMEKCEATI